MDYEIIMPQATRTIVVSNIKSIFLNEHGQTVFYDQDAIVAIAPKDAAIKLILVNKNNNLEWVNHSCMTNLPTYLKSEAP